MTTSIHHRAEDPGSEKSFDPYHMWLGIPSNEQPPHFYRLLGIAAFENDPDVIASAADRQMAHVRTFQSSKHAALSQKLLNEIAAAKLRLLKPGTKTIYDMQLRQQIGQRSVAERASGTRRLPRAKALSIKGRTANQRVHNGNESAVVSGDVRPSEDNSAGDLSSTSDHASSSPVSHCTVKRIVRSKLGQWAGSAMALVLVGTLAWIAAQPKPRPSPESRLTVPLPSIHGHANARRAAKPHGEHRSERLTKSEDVATSASSSTINLENTTVDVASNSRQEPSFGHSQRIDAATEVHPGTLPIFTSPPGDASVNEASVEVDPASTAIDEQPPQAGVAMAKRLSIPDMADRQAIQQRLAKVYDPAEATTPRAKVKLANQYLEAAEQSQHEVERFVLFERAAELANDGGDAQLVLQAIDTLDSQFEIDAIETKGTALLRFSKNAAIPSNERLRSLMTAADGFIKQAIEANRFEIALDVTDAIVRASRRSSNKECRKEATGRRDAVRAAYQQVEELHKAQAALEANADDETANLVLGRWYCYAKDDWQQGLLYLSRVGDKDLQRLARREAKSPPSGAEDQVQLADAWWDLARSRKAEERESLLLHAGYWYEQALVTTVLGLTKLKIEKRLEELAGTRKHREQQRSSGPSLSVGATPARLWNN